MATAPIEADRLRVTARERERYATEPGYRLARINHSRALRGMPLVADLSEVRGRGRFA